MAYTRVSDANEITEKYMDSILIEERLIDSVKADLSTTFLGERFDMPVMTPAFSHLGNYNGREYTGLEEYSMAARDCNILNFCGMMENDMFRRIVDTGAKTVRIVKPYADNGKVRDQFAFAEEVGAFGADVYKALALGANAAAVGRLMLPALENEGAEGVKKFFTGVGNEFRFIMSCTGFSRVPDIDSSAIVLG